MFKKKSNNLDRYTDPTGEITNKQLKMSGWYVRHRNHMFNILVGSLIIFNIVTIGFSFWKWGEYLLFGYEQDNNILVQQLDEFPDYQSVHHVYGANDLKLGPTLVVPNDDNRYDFVSEVFNNNERWIANVRYKFVFAGGETGVHEVQIMPRVKLPLPVLSEKVSGFPSSAKIFIEEVSWEHIDTHKVPYVDSYLADRLTFTTSDLEFVYAGEGGIDTHQIKFKVTNDTLFGYWNPKFYVDLLDGGQRVGTLFFTLDQFGAGETQVVDLRSFAEDIYVSEINLHPLIDIFDQSEFVL